MRGEADPGDTQVKSTLHKERPVHWADFSYQKDSLYFLLLYSHLSLIFSTDWDFEGSLFHSATLSCSGYSSVCKEDGLAGRERKKETRKLEHQILLHQEREKLAWPTDYIFQLFRGHEEVYHFSWYNHQRWGRREHPLITFCLKDEADLSIPSTMDFSAGKSHSRLLDNCWHWCLAMDITLVNKYPLGSNCPAAWRA